MYNSRNRHGILFTNRITEFTVSYNRFRSCWNYLFSNRTIWVVRVDKIKKVRGDWDRQFILCNIKSFYFIISMYSWKFSLWVNRFLICHFQLNQSSSAILDQCPFPVNQFSFLSTGYILLINRCRIQNFNSYFKKYGHQKFDR